MKNEFKKSITNSFTKSIIETKRKTQKMKPIGGSDHPGDEIVRNYDLRFTNYDLSGNRKI